MTACPQTINGLKVRIERQQSRTMLQTTGGDPEVIGGNGLALAPQGGINQRIEIGGGSGARCRLHAPAAKELGELTAVAALAAACGKARQQLPQYGHTDDDNRRVLQHAQDGSVTAFEGPVSIGIDGNGAHTLMPQRGVNFSKGSRLALKSKRLVGTPGASQGVEVVKLL